MAGFYEIGVGRISHTRVPRAIIMVEGPLRSLNTPLRCHGSRHGFMCASIDGQNDTLIPLR